MALVFRYMAAIVAGMIVTFVLVFAVEALNAAVHPAPPDFKGTMEEMCLHVEHYPNWVLALVVPAWTGTAFTGTWIAGRIGNRMCALFIGLLVVAAVAFNVSMLPYALWFKIVILLVIPVAVVLGDRWSIRRSPRVAK